MVVFLEIYEVIGWLLVVDLWGNWICEKSLFGGGCGFLLSLGYEKWDEDGHQIMMVAWRDEDGHVWFVK